MHYFLEEEEDLMVSFMEYIYLRFDNEKTAATRMCSKTSILQIQSYPLIQRED